MVLKAVKTGWYSQQYVVTQGSFEVATIDPAWTSESGTCVIQGRSYELGREGEAGGAFYIKQYGTNIAQAVKPSAWFRSFDITFDRSTYTLKALTYFFRNYTLLQDERKIGLIRAEGIFSQRLSADLPDNLPLEIKVFMAWLVIVMCNREEDRGHDGAVGDYGD